MQRPGNAGATRIHRRVFLAGSLAGLTFASGAAPAQATDGMAMVNFALGVLWARVPASRWLTPLAHALVVSPMGSSLSALLMNDDELGFEAPPRAMLKTSILPTASDGANPHHSVLLFFASGSVEEFLMRTSKRRGVRMPEGTVTIDGRLARRSSRPEAWQPHSVMRVPFTETGVLPGNPETFRVFRLAGR